MPINTNFDKKKYSDLIVKASIFILFDVKNVLLPVP